VADHLHIKKDETRGKQMMNETLLKSKCKRESNIKVNLTVCKLKRTFTEDTAKCLAFVMTVLNLRLSVASCICQ
jgi:hypothetical protein